MKSKTQLLGGWKVVPLANVAEIVMGQSPPGSTVSEWDGDSRVDTGLPFIQGNAEFGDMFPQPAKWCGRPVKIAERGDTLISVRAPVGEVNRAGERTAIGRGLAAIRFTSADSHFGWHIVNHAKHEFDRVTQGSTFQAIGGNELRALSVFLPPLAEQRAIATVLDSIDEAIDRTDAVIAATERLRDSLLHELLTRGVPGWHSEWKEARGIETIPACWEVVRLGELAEVASGQTDPTRAKFQDSLFIASDDIESGTGRLSNRRTVAEARVISGKYQFNEFDVLYSKIRPYLAKVYRPHESGLCSADIYPLRPNSMLDATYLVLALLSPSFTSYTRTCSDRTGIPKINRIDLFKYPFALPPLAEQETVAAMLNGVDNTIERGREQRDVLQLMKTATSDALLTGHVRVSA